MRALNVDEKEIKGYVLRRSPRAMVKVPVVIKGVDKQGYEFEEETETYVVSKYGARVFSIHELDVDDVLRLRLRDSQDWSDFRVVWVGKEGDTAGGVGIEFIQATNFFGIKFPSEDWS
jgi:PilZ domain-containing protein